MKAPYDEGYFLKNGEKTPVHCQLFKRKKKNRVCDFHYHNYIEILFGINCDNLVWIDEQLHPFKTGDVCFINHSKPHYVYSNTDYTEYIYLKFSPELLSYKGQPAYEMKYVLSMLENKGDFKKVITKDEVAENSMGEIVQRILREWKEQKPGYEFAVRGEILNLFSRFIRIWEKKKTIAYSSENSQIAQIILSASEFASENFADINEKELAERFNMSYSYFSRMFKRIMGKSFASYITELKIEEGKRLLLTCDKTVTEIAANIGFSTTSHFISCFSKQFSMTPFQYRKKYKSGLEIM